MFEELLLESFDARERRILQFWKSQQIFEKSVSSRKKDSLFSFYDGPPFATGLPHYGHILAGTIKDVVLRYKTMKGFYVPRRFGWDCHGLPIENEIERTFNLSGANAIEEFGIDRFNEECRNIVLRYTTEWQSVVERMGRWVDFNNTYRTMDSSFMESVWWVFKQLFEKGLVYEGYKVMPFSAKLGTPLSNFEAGENYKEVDDPSLTVAMPLEKDPHTALLIWTTTPWTLISNLAVMAGPEIVYATIRDHATGRHYILAENRLSSYYASADEYSLISTCKGRELAGIQYRPPFDYFADRMEKGAFRVILEESVSTEEGTGLVHSAPAFGEVDFYACQREGIELVCPVDHNGRFMEEIPEYAGLFVKDADKDIIKRLKKEGRIIKHATVHHRYPFCWRSDTPLIYKAVKTWFVSVEKIKEQLVRANQAIHWTPNYIKDGRFGKWLEGARDWAISRNRYWGTPIPIWRAPDGEIKVIESAAELEAITKSKISDLHRHFIDQKSFEHHGKQFTRISEVFDCWFESGSMPYAQLHYPFENQEVFKQGFPADFIAEGLDQTRGWFYTLTVLSAALFQKPAFKNVVVNGIVLAADGNKMSKRLRNYPDPMEVVHKYGADAVRLYMMYSPAVRADDLCFQEGGVELVLRQILIPWWNAYSFLVTYARIYQWKPDQQMVNHPLQPDAPMDRWILSQLNKLIVEVSAGMEDYDISRGVEPLVGFIDQLTNWYIRRSRRRFWEEMDTPDRHQAFMTLYRVLLDLTKIAAPFVPFISEAIYRNLRLESDPESVHLCDFPKAHPEMRDPALESSMEVVQTAVSLGHSLRKEHKLKVRQPLEKAYVVSGDPITIRFLQEQQHLIVDELNVKSVEFGTEETAFVALQAKPNFRLLGKKVGKRMKAVQESIGKLTHAQLTALGEGESLQLTVEGELMEFTPEEIQIERQVHEGMIAANAGNITLALETNLTEALIEEGLMRELINKLNTMRRENGLAVSDRIQVKMQTTPRLEQCFETYGEYIQKEVLAVSIEFGDCEGTVWDLNGEAATILIFKVTRELQN